MGRAHSKDYNHYPVLGNSEQQKECLCLIVTHQGLIALKPEVPSTNPAGPPGLLSCEGNGWHLSVLTVLLENSTACSGKLNTENIICFGLMF